MLFLALSQTFAEWVVKLMEGVSETWFIYVGLLFLGIAFGQLIAWGQSRNGRRWLERRASLIEIKNTKGRIEEKENLERNMTLGSPDPARIREINAKCTVEFLDHIRDIERISIRAIDQHDQEFGYVDIDNQAVPVRVKGSREEIHAFRVVYGYTSVSKAPYASEPFVTYTRPKFTLAPKQNNAVEFERTQSFFIELALVSRTGLEKHRFKVSVNYDNYMGEPEYPASGVTRWTGM